MINPSSFFNKQIFFHETFPCFWSSLLHDFTCKNQALDLANKCLKGNLLIEKLLFNLLFDNKLYNDKYNYIIVIIYANCNVV